MNEEDYQVDQTNDGFADYNSTLSTTLGTGTYAFSPSLGTASTITSTTGGTLSTTLTNGLLWNNPTYTATATATPYTYGVATGNVSGTWSTYNQPQTLKVSGDAEFEGDIKIKGVNLTDRLDAIEERLGILRPNNDLEGKWEKLKKLGEEYRRLEKEILEGENIWDMLKK
jgi:hypothetical protein